MSLTYISLIVSLIALLWAFVLALQIKREKVENKRALEISSFIKEGTEAFLKKEYSILFIFIFIAAILFSITPIGWKVGVSCLLGGVFSALAGLIGMRIATESNVRCVEKAKINLVRGLIVAFSSGSVMGLSVVGLGLLGVSILYLVFKDPRIVYGFGFGASFVALFARVGGGIFTKAADVGADLVGKVEKGIPEDDPRNPAVIADNVGDNVGDVTGMGADLFESYVDSIIAAMVLGLTSFWFKEKAVVLPLFVASLGVLASILGAFIIKLRKKGRPENILNSGVFSAGILFTLFSFLAIKFLSLSLNIFWVLICGLAAGIIIGLVTEYYTSAAGKPAQKIAQSSETGAGTNVIYGLAIGMESTLIPILAVSGAILLSYKLAGLYGIGICAVGMLSTLGITLATDCYGPVADNAAGIAEMAEMGEETRERAEKLDAVGNTTAAIGKGFAIGSAALTALVLAASYSQLVRIEVIDLLEVRVLVGLLIGGMFPFIFSSIALRAVGKAAFGIVQEVRRQFREIPGLMEGKAKPDYSRCVKISTNAALKQMIGPAIGAVILPIFIGFSLGKGALGGLLIGAIVTGFLLAIMMANSGGAWDNAKKFIEAGNLGGKGSPSHKAAVVGDTVGDPFKDTAGPSLNILIKLMAIVSLIIAPLL